MTQLTADQQFDAAMGYETVMVPALFSHWTAQVADAAHLHPGHRVLDVACGTGILAREAATRVGAGGFVAGLDPTPGMLAVARHLAPAIDWRAGVAESLPFADAAFDAVVSQFGAMFFRDRNQALREMLRVLVPGGTLAVAVWDSLEHFAAHRIEVEVIERVAGQRAADALRAPFALGDTDALAAWFEAVDVQAVRVATHHGTARFASIRTMVEADLRGCLPVLGITLDAAMIEQILAAAEDALKDYVTADGRVEFDSPAHIVSGHKAGVH